MGVGPQEGAKPHLGMLLTPCKWQPTAIWVPHPARAVNPKHAPDLCKRPTWLLVAVASSGALGCALSAVIVPLLWASITCRWRQRG